MPPEPDEAQGAPGLTTASAGAAYSIRAMRSSDAAMVARLHRECIPTGFLSSLGAAFLGQLYKGIAACRQGFVLVAADDAERVIGFAAGATDVRALYRGILLRRGWLLCLCACSRLWRWSMIREVVDSLRYPSRVEGEFPAAELLSIAVEEAWRGRSVAAGLMQGVTAEFARRGCRRYKVVVGAGLERANVFYRKHGLRPVGTVESHGRQAKVYAGDVEVQ